MSQAELAERVDLSVQHISNIENARTKVGLEKLVDISNALDSSVDEFLFGIPLVLDTENLVERFPKLSV